MPRYAVIDKTVGETPLHALERYRQTSEALAAVPLAYAGRLDPMASGKLLILIGDECKRQKEYHGLDKEYRFEVLFGVGSDTGDVLGRLTYRSNPPEIDVADIERVTRSLSGTTPSLPYPKFSAKTVRGKPLHMWTLEGRLDEIEIPTATTTLYKLTCTGVRSVPATTIAEEVRAKIDTLPVVTDPRKALGEDFRREKVLADWQRFEEEAGEHEYQVASYTCIASSGTYMRSLAEHIGDRFGVPALAYSIHRTKIGRYIPLLSGFGFWRRLY
ncbi:MAG: hypothetical protein WDZ93_02080 [Candidatus Paceibacterota bacterium]